MKYEAHRNDKVASGSQRHLKSHSEVTSGAGTSTAPHLLEQQQFLECTGCSSTLSAFLSGLLE